MGSYERAGNPPLPQWWLDKAIPLLSSDTFKHSEIAEVASKVVGRSSPWTASSISKFKDGTGQTVDLANGISDALRIPHPFFIAPTEKAALEMQQIAARELEAKRPNPEREIRLTAIDSTVDAVDSVENDQTSTVPSGDDERRNRGGRAGRSPRRSS